MARPGRSAATAPLLVAALLLLVAAAPSPSAANAIERPILLVPPQLPVALGPKFLTGLAVAPTEPGGSVPLAFALSNPLGYPLANVTLAFELYAFNPFPGTGVQSLPGGAATFSSGTASTTNLSLPAGSLAAHATNWSAPVTFHAGSGAPEGTYAIRDRLTFDLNGSRYILASVGNFPTEVWQNATVLANGSPTVNLTRLAVSGLLPETAVLVRSNTAFDATLYVVLAAAGLLALAAVYVSGRRRGPTSRSGTSSAPEESHAESALGKSRSKDGD